MNANSPTRSSQQAFSLHRQMKPHIKRACILLSAFLAVLLAPTRALLGGFAALTLRLVGSERTQGEPEITEEELRTLVDVGAREEIYRLMRQKASEGLAILLSSEDMLELIGMSDRLVVLRQGVMVREFDSLEDVEEHDIVQYMT